MVIMIERIEERVRNMVGPFYTMVILFRNLKDEKEWENIDVSLKYLIEHSEQLISAMENSINYLIDMAKIIDKHLPKDFDINKLLDKEKYQS
jgi:hypothetical protein